MVRMSSHFLRYFTSKLSSYTGPAFVFDIDGVLLRGKKVLPPAYSAMQMLYNHPSNSWRFPTAFLTNGGGTTEAARAKLLTSQLKVPIHESQVVLSHSPMRNYVQLYKHRAILTVGGTHCAQIARHYGFPHAIDTSTLATLVPSATPFARSSDIVPTNMDKSTSQMPIAAVFVMTDSRDWGRDAQLLMDTLHNAAQYQPQGIDLYICNGDLHFSNEHNAPRLAGGAFALAFEALFSHITGRAPRIERLGKPHRPNYHMAERALQTHAAMLGFDTISPSAIYAIGDNPASDVRGANAQAPPWASVLVRTGNFKGDNDERDVADVVVDDVELAVRYGLNVTCQT